LNIFKVIPLLVFLKLKRVIKTLKRQKGRDYVMERAYPKRVENLL